MKNKVLCAAFFVAGTVVGFVGAHLILEKKYKEKLEDKDAEIESVKERFDRRYERLEESRKNAEKAAIEEYTKKYQEAVAATKTYLGMDETDKDPYQIQADEMGEFEDYDVLSYTYYTDGVLADEMDEEVEDINGEVGFEFFKYFENGADVVYIRNDARKCDYEIVRENTAYSNFAEPSHPDWSPND